MMTFLSDLAGAALTALLWTMGALLIVLALFLLAMMVGQRLAHAREVETRDACCNIQGNGNAAEK